MDIWFPKENHEYFLNIHWKGLCWNWSSNTTAIWWKEQTHWKRPWYWERLKAWGKVGDRGWGGWMTSLNQWTCLTKLQERVKDRKTWRAVVHRVTNSRTQLSDWTRYMETYVWVPSFFTWKYHNVVNRLHLNRRCKRKWKSLRLVQLFATPWTIQSREFSSPEYWSG